MISTYISNPCSSKTKRLGYPGKRGAKMRIIEGAIYVVIASIAWILVGFIVGVPYTFLSGGTYEHFVAVAALSPIGIFLLFIAYLTSRYATRGGRIGPKWGGGLFLLAVIWFCMPIISNGVSLILKLIGCQAASQLVFEARYFSLQLPITVFLAFMLLCWMFCSIKDKTLIIAKKFNKDRQPSD